MQKQTQPQKTLRFTFKPEPGQLKVNHRLFEQWFNEFKPTHTYHPTELLAQLLRRQSRGVLHDITNCAPHLIAVQLDRLRDLCDTIDLACRHSLIAVEEHRLSGLQLSTPITVMDYRACLDHALQYHRSPVKVANDEVLQRLDVLAAYVARLNGSNGSPQSQSLEAGARDVESGVQL